jgi:hypothetical protein
MFHVVSYPRGVARNRCVGAERMGASRLRIASVATKSCCPQEIAAIWIQRFLAEFSSVAFRALRRCDKRLVSPLVCSRWRDGRRCMRERSWCQWPRCVSTAEQCSRWRTGPTHPGRSLTGGSNAQCSRYPPGRNGGPATFSPAAEVAFLKDDKVPGCRAILITTLERQEVERVISQ